MRELRVEAYRYDGEVRVEEWPGEEDEVGPYVEHLRKVQGCYMVAFVAEDDAAVPVYESAEDGEERKERTECAQEVEEAGWVEEIFEGEGYEASGCVDVVCCELVDGLV